MTSLWRHDDVINRGKILTDFCENSRFSVPIFASKEAIWLKMLLFRICSKFIEVSNGGVQIPIIYFLFWDNAVWSRAYKQSWKTENTKSCNEVISVCRVSLTLWSSIIIDKDRNCGVEWFLERFSKSCTWGATPKIAKIRKNHQNCRKTLILSILSLYISVKNDLSFFSV